MNPNDPKPDRDRPSLLQEIGRGWEWVVFSVKMLSRVGGPIEIIQTIMNSAKILVSRTLRQWGVGAK